MPSLRRRKSRSRTLQTAAFLWTMWRWLPASQKRNVLLLARRHGPWIASAMLKQRRSRR